MHGSLKGFVFFFLPGELVLHKELNTISTRSLNYLPQFWLAKDATHAAV